VGWAYAVEGGGGRRLHAHALLRGMRHAVLPAAEALWIARNGRFESTEVYDAKGAAGYLCKRVGPNAKSCSVPVFAREESHCGEEAMSDVAARGLWLQSRPITADLC